MQNEKVISISEEFLSVDFGDKRLNRRLGNLGEALSSRPKESFPKALGTISELEATYRFLRNPRVTPEGILSSHISSTVERAKAKDRVLVVHDSSEFIFSGDSRKSEVGSTRQNNLGFLGHFSLAVSRTSFVHPLGILGLSCFFSTPDKNRKENRWWDQIHQTHYLLPSKVNPIHVMDREADEYGLFCNLISQKVRFVARVKFDRNFCSTVDCEKTKLFKLLEGLEVTCERQVSVSKRKGHKLPNQRKKLPARNARMAKLHLSATCVEITRPKHVPEQLAPSVTMHCVHVYELKAPEGEAPVDWKLYTSEPINSAKDLLSIVDDYRARWTIEEYFKALKSGCGYEKRQLETKHTLMNALAVFTPIAWQLLLLRSLPLEYQHSPASMALNSTQIKILQNTGKSPLPHSPTVHDALMAIARLGGHIPNNGRPGWMILGRGMETLLTMEVAWNMAQNVFLKERCDQS